MENLDGLNNLDFSFFCSGCTETKEHRLKNCFTGYRIKEFDKSEYLAIKGEVVKDLQIVVSGRISVSVVLESGLIIRSTEHDAPYPIGALALLSNKNNEYRVDVEACEPCISIYVSKEEVENRLMSCRNFLSNFIDHSGSRVDVFVEHLAILCQKSIKSKLAYYILICSDGKTYKFKKNISDLAEHLCVERPSLSRIISNLVSSKIVTYKRGEGEILDIEALRLMVE